MITDSPPRSAPLRRQYDASDALATLDLPAPDALRAATQDLVEHVEAGVAADVRRAGNGLLDVLASHYAIARPRLAVLGVRPHRVWDGQLSYELFGDYTPDKQSIRVWLRTAVQGRVTSPRGLLSTLLHEFCHHLDVTRFGYRRTPHTRGFFHRVDALYHHALGTPPDQRGPLRWIPSGARFRIDWTALRRR